MKCPYCNTIVADNQKRCPICNADLSVCAPDPCDVIPDENGHCAMHDDYNHTLRQEVNNLPADKQEELTQHPILKNVLEKAADVQEKASHTYDRHFDPLIALLCVGVFIFTLMITGNTVSPMIALAVIGSALKPIMSKKDKK